MQAWIFGWLLSSAGTLSSAVVGPRTASALLLGDAPPAVVQPHHRPWLDIPIVTWVAGGLAAGAFGTGLGFGVAASDIDHRSGLSVSATGVDLGLTRATALAGQRDAQIANGLFIGAGIAALIGLAFAAFAPETASPTQ